MGTTGWTINPTNGASINQTTGEAHFDPNTSTTDDKKYTITYTDANGCTASTEYTVKKAECAAETISIWRDAPLPISGSSVEIARFVGSADMRTEKYEINVSGPGAAVLSNIHIGTDGLIYTVLADISNGCNYLGENITISVTDKECTLKTGSCNTVIGIKKSYYVYGTVNHAPGTSYPDATNVFVTFECPYKNCTGTKTIGPILIMATMGAMEFNDELKDGNYNVLSVTVMEYPTTIFPPTVVSVIKNGSNINVTYNY